MKIACAALALLLLVVAVTSADLNQADILYRARKYDDAISAYTAVLPDLTGKDKATVLKNIGLCQRYRGQYVQAIETLTQAIGTANLEPIDAATCRLHIGYCHYLLTQYDQSMVFLQAVLDDSAASTGTRVDAALYAGYMLNKQKLYDEAIVMFELALNMTDAHPHSRAQGAICIGNVYRVLGKLPEARAAYLRINEIEGPLGRQRVIVDTRLEEIDTILAGDDPFYIAPYVTAVQGDKAEVFWISKGDVTGATVTLTAGEESLTAMPLSSAIADGGFVRHRAAFAGLKPGVVYERVVTTAGIENKGQFRSARIDDKPFNFCVLGDTQTMAPVHTRVAAQIAKHKPEFVVLVGDLVESGSQWFQWKSQLFGPGQAYLPSTTFWPVRGNHDGGPYYPRLFGLEEKQYYSFDYGNIHVAVIDSFGPGMARKKREEQVQWLREDLKNTKATWTIVALHDPMVTTDSVNHWFGEEDFLPVINECEVDFVLSGHHHLYRRYMPIGLPGKKPTFHITTGGAGGGLGGCYPSPLMVRGAETHHHLNFHVDGNRLELTVVTMDGEPLDSLTLVKDNGRYQEEIMAQAVPFTEARQLACLYYEMLVPNSHTTVTADIDSNNPAQVTLNLATLAGGGTSAASFPEGTSLIFSQDPKCAWQVREQKVPLAGGILQFDAQPPANNRLPLTVKVAASLNSRTFEPAVLTFQPRE